MKTFISLVLIALAVGSYYVYINPEYQKIKTLRLEESQYLEAQANALELTQVYNRLATEFNNLPQSDVDRLNVFLPNSFDQTRFAMNLDSVATRYSVRISEVQGAQTNVSTNTETSKNLVRSHVVTIKFKSQYQNAIQFLKDIESNLTLTDVVRVSFFATDSGIYDFSVSLQTYSINDK